MGHSLGEMELGVLLNCVAEEQYWHPQRVCVFGETTITAFN